MTILSKELFDRSGNNEGISGVVLIKGYTTRTTKNGKPYIEGKLSAGKEIPFKVWNDSGAFKPLTDFDFSNTIAFINGSVNDYQGTRSIIVTSVDAVEGYDPIDFMEKRYNKEAYQQALISLCKQKVSEKGMTLLNKILFENAEVWNAFSNEFAASSHHDNCPSGLLVHTYKATCLMAWALQTYAPLSVINGKEAVTDTTDLYYIGVVLHDIGKLKEMHYGVYQPLSAVTHRILGLDYLYAVKEAIIAAYGEKWFRDLQSIIVEHHGEFGDPCRTLVAFVVHQVDLVDSRLTNAAQAIIDGQANGVTDKIYMDGSYLAL